jgi:hypothetical protein
MDALRQARRELLWAMVEWVRVVNDGRVGVRGCERALLRIRIAREQIRKMKGEGR